jgi:hypothetical protein
LRRKANSNGDRAPSATSSRLASSIGRQLIFLRLVVDDHAVATAEVATGDRRRHVHPVVAFGAQTVELRSRLMAGGGSWTGSQQRRPHLREPGAAKST